jgi:hypothetical protein
VDVTGSRSFADDNVSCIKPSGSAATMLNSYILKQHGGVPYLFSFQFFSNN